MFFFSPSVNNTISQVGHTKKFFPMLMILLVMLVTLKSDDIFRHALHGYHKPVIITNFNNATITVGTLTVEKLVDFNFF